MSLNLIALRIWILIFCTSLQICIYGVDLQKDSEAIFNTYFNRVHPYEKKWIEESNFSLNQLKKKLSEKKSLKSEFYALAKLSDYFSREISTGLIHYNRKKSRYDGIIPYDDVRTLRHIEGFYLSASDVITEEQYYILTQAPLDSTLNDFWKAILETKTQTIVKLMTPSEKKGDYPYYCHRSKFPYRIGDWTINLLNETTLEAKMIKKLQAIVERRLLASNSKTGEVRPIRHIHYENWPDGRAADVELFAKLLEIVDREPHPTSPLVVHCAAGVGRTGTFVLAHTLRRKAMKTYFNMNQTILNPIKTLALLRMQRRHLISTSEQYRNAIAALLYFQK